MLKPVNITFKYLFCQILLKIWKKNQMKITFWRNDFSGGSQEFGILAIMVLSLETHGKR